MLIFLLKFSACLSVFMLFYKVFLERSSIHQFKRFYLLGAILIACVIPFLTITEYIEPVSLTEFSITESLPVIDDSEMILEETPIDYVPIILWSIYGLGVFVFLLKFCRNLMSIVSRIKRYPKYKLGSIINVLITQPIAPHTFFKYIFLNKHKFEKNDIPNEVILHEQTHAKQMHSIDVFLIEVLQIILWFNPLIYFLKRDIKLNHEFLADNAVLKKGIQPSAYQELLLTFSIHPSEPQLANAINYSSIKKRFTVMKTNTSKTSIWIRSLLLLPLLALLFYSFGKRVQVEKENNDPIKNSSLISEGVSEALLKEYKAFIIEYNKTHFINYPKYERIVSIYNLMSSKQRASVEKYPIVPNIDLSKTKAKSPSKDEFESWKNEKQYALWVDGIPISNAKLNSYTHNDIVHYTGSFVHKNARSNSFPQPYQFNLYTKEGFNSAFQDSKVIEYRTLTEKYHNAIQVFLNGERNDDTELRLLLERCRRLYESFSKEDLKKYKLLPPPPPPALKSPQQGATQKQLAEYNKLAKHCNSQINQETQPIIKKKVVVRLKKLYGLMSQEQKDKAEPFPDFSKFPPPPPPPPIPDNATPEQRKKMQTVIDDYEKKHKRKVHQMRSDNVVYNIISDDENYDPSESTNLTYRQNTDPKTGFKKINNQLHYFVTIGKKKKYFNRKGFQVSKEGKTISSGQVNASDVIPGQYITKVYTGNTIFAEFKDNDPSRTDDIVDNPPPPPPIHKSSLDFAIELAKKNAKFHFEYKEISSDKAIALLKENPDLNMLAKKTATKQPIVYISEKPITANKAQKSKELVQLNGKTPIDGLLVLLPSDFNNLKLTLKDSKVVSFKFKIRGKPTQVNKSNTLNDISKSQIKKLEKGAVVQFFDVKDSKGFVHPPIAVQVSGKLVGVKGE